MYLNATHYCYTTLTSQLCILHDTRKSNYTMMYLISYYLQSSSNSFMTIWNFLKNQNPIQKNTKCNHSSTLHFSYILLHVVEHTSLLFDKTLLQIKHNFYESKILYKRFNKDHNINAPFIPIFLPTFFLNVYDHHQRFHAFIHMITIPSIFSVSFMSLLKRTMIHYLLELMFCSCIRLSIHICIY